MKRFIKKGCLGMVLAAAILGGSSIPASAQGNRIGTFEGHAVYDNRYEDLDIKKVPKSAINRYGAGFPGSYDPRKMGLVTAIEDQYDSMNCWAFASVAAIESNLLKKGYANASLNLSENHLAYFFYNRQTDRLGYTEGDYNQPVGATWAQRGGTLSGAGIHLQTWSGVVTEPVYEDQNGVYTPYEYSGANLKKECYKSDYRVTNTYFLYNDVNLIKQAIMKHGAVACGIYTPINDYYQSLFWDMEKGSSYCYIDGNVDSNCIGNHAVTIVGWDDNYDKNNFVKAPQNNGAWIIKNSYGNIGDGGYMYVSYEDKSLAEFMAFEAEPAGKTCDNNYQHDGTAFPLALPFNNGTKYANVFKAKASSSEVLKAVSFETLTPGVSYSIQVYAGVDDVEGPTSGKKMLKSPKTGVLEEVGYQTVKLNKGVVLQKGQTYSVVVTLSSKYYNQVDIGIDLPYNAGWINFDSNVGDCQSFVNMGGGWEDASGIPVNTGAGYAYGFNFRIKAYTDDITYRLEDKVFGVSKGTSATIKINSNNKSYLKKIKWTSSDKKIATVNSKGKITGKSYGTTTVKAEFMVGSKKKTLKCKVTVGPSKISKFNVSAGTGKISVSWKKNNAASGYVVYYSTNASSGFKTLKTISKKSTIKCSKSKLAAGTYYVKMRPYKKQGSKKLYGTYTKTKKVTVK